MPRLADCFDSDDKDRNLGNFMQMYDAVRKHYHELPDMLRETERAKGTERRHLEEKLEDCRDWVREAREANDILKNEKLLAWYHIERYPRWMDRYNEAQDKLKKMDRDITKMLDEDKGQQVIFSVVIWRPEEIFER